MSEASQREDKRTHNFFLLIDVTRSRAFYAHPSPEHTQAIQAASNMDTATRSAATTPLQS
eukprot:scaffold909_cov135-Cylindrotheca_fusiformis.AAC.3